MSLDQLPRGYDAWRTRTPWDDEPDHIKSCPLYEEKPDGETAECKCPTKADIALDRAEYLRDRRRDGC